MTTSSSLLPGARERGHAARLERPLDLADGQHAAAARREDGAVLAPRLRDRLVQERAHPDDGRSRSRCSASTAWGTSATLLLDALARPGHDLLAGQQREPRRRGRTRTTAASCSSCSRWASATTPRPTSRMRRAPSPAGPSSSRSRCYPYGHYASRFVYRRRKTTTTARRRSSARPGNFNGEDIIDIIVKQEATARFISRHLYNFFVADEPQVPAWSVTEPQRSAGDRRRSSQAFLDSDADMRGGDARAVQQRLLQGRPLQAGQVPDRAHRRRPQAVRHAPRARAWR